MAAPTIRRTVLQTPPRAVSGLSYHPTLPVFAACGAGEVIVSRDDGTVLDRFDSLGCYAVAYGAQGQLCVAAEGRVDWLPAGSASQWTSMDLGQHGSSEISMTLAAVAWLDETTVVGLDHRNHLLWLDLTQAKETRRIDAKADRLVASSKVGLVVAFGKPYVQCFDLEGNKKWEWLGLQSDVDVHPTEPFVVRTGAGASGAGIEVVDAAGEIVSATTHAALEGGQEAFRQTRVRFVPSTSLIIVAHATGFSLWDWKNNALAGTSKQPLALQWLAVRPDCRRVIGAGTQELAVWDMEDKAVVTKPTHKWKLPGPVGPAWSVQAESDRLAVGLKTQVAVWAPEGLQHFVKKCGVAYINALSLIPGRAQVVCGSESATAILRDLTGDGSIKMKAPVGNVRSIAVNAAGDTIVLGKRRWDLTGTAAKKVAFGYYTAMLSNGDRLLSTSEEADEADAGVVELKRLDGSTIRKLVVPHDHDFRVLCLAASPSGDRLAVAREDGCLSLYDGDGELISATKPEIYPSFCALAFSPNGERFVSLSWDGVARLWNAKLDLTRELSGVRPHENGICFLTDDVLAVTGQGEHVELIHLESDRRVSLVAASDKAWVAFDKAGKYLGSKAGLKLLRISSWDGETIDVDQPKSSSPDLLREFFAG